MAHILWSVVLIILFGVVGFFWWKDRKYLQKKTSETMSPELWKEIEAERLSNLDKRRKFREALEQAKKKS